MNDIGDVLSIANDKYSNHVGQRINLVSVSIQNTCMAMPHKISVSTHTSHSHELLWAHEKYSCLLGMEYQRDL